MVVNCYAMYGNDLRRKGLYKPIMSRIGKLPITLPKNVAIDVRGSDVTVKGPKGELYRSFHPAMSITINDDHILVSRPNDQKMYRALHGLTRSLLANMVEGVDKGFERILDIVGVGYRVQQSGEKLVLQIGYAHPVEVLSPPGISLIAEGVKSHQSSGYRQGISGQCCLENSRYTSSGFL